MSPGSKYLLREFAGWVSIVVLAAVALQNYQDIQKFAAPYLGLVPSGGWSDAPKDYTRSKFAVEPDVSSYGEVRISRGRGGHYSVRAELNNRSADVLVDTGATLVALTYEDARRAGIFVSGSDFKYRSRTANGIARSARVTIGRLRIGDITLRNVRASVSEPGALHVTLLGMSFLGRLSRVEMRAGELILQK